MDGSDPDLLHYSLNNFKNLHLYKYKNKVDILHTVPVPTYLLNNDKQTEIKKIGADPEH